jgi:hypothetical protein
VEYPAWITDYRTLAEGEASKKITELATRVEHLKRQIADQRATVEDALQLKKLIVATDAAFLGAVATAEGIEPNGC